MSVATRLSLSQRQHLYQLMSTAPLKPVQSHCQPTGTVTRTRIQPLHVPSGPRSCFRKSSGGAVNKKRVVFADAIGLALTAVRLFIPEPSSPTPTLVTNPSLASLQGQESTINKQQRYKLHLEFQQPTKDMKTLYARLREMRVQLVSCSVSELSLSGKVFALRDSAEAAVNVWVTFDSWRSYHDIPCKFLHQQRYLSSEMDVFTFDLRLPQNIDPNKRIEFRVSLKSGPDTMPHWDDNRGQNYRVCMENDTPNASKLVDATRFYSSLSKYRLPSWSPYMSPGLQNPAYSQYLPENLSSRVRADCKTLCLVK